MTAPLILPFLATMAFAVGSDDTPPKPTETSTQCPDGEVFDKEKKECVKSASLDLNDDDRYEAVRELAYAGRSESALMVIASADGAETPRFLTYRGFALRQTGDYDGAMAAYRKALDIDPHHILARSYMAQGMLQQGDYAGAHEQLKLIEAQGGRETWAYVALVQAIRGEPTRY
ncbi:tetratricopeptide repeat protein [Pseudooceanicola sp.]|uniref:tetratricopeptide repeat protein n=1 Tax=Pseudooceanicola sp. TaxID=1914328 RepID=UPI0035C6F921